MAADDSARHQQYALGEVLVTPEWLDQHLGDPAVRVVEVDVSRAAYDAGHIEGAVLWNVYSDLKDSSYQLADKAATEDLLARSGISRDSTVVLYGYAPALGMWLLKLYGHGDVRLLDCARGTWHDEGRRWTTTVAAPARTVYRLPAKDDRIRADHRRVADAIGDPDCAIIDVRTEAEYSGERFWPSGGAEPGGRAGHVPSAVNLSVENVYDERGSFLTAAELRKLFSALDLDGNREMITYCTIGGRASTAWFILEHLLGRGGVRVYDNSWAEWGRRPATPVESTWTSAP